MFVKLLKQDMKAVWRMWWLLLPVVPVLSITASLLMRYVLTCSQNKQFGVFYTFAILALMLVFAVYIASTFYTSVLVFIRFYKNLYTDEAYLTFTLPAKRGTILAAKTANAMIWEFAHLSVLLIGLLPVLLIASPPAENGFFLNPAAFVTIWKAICEMWKLIGAWTLVYALEVILLTVLIEFASIAMIQFCITFGATVVKKAKLVLAIGMYYALSTVVGIFGEILLLFGIYFLGNGIAQLMPEPSFTASTVFVALTIAVFCAIAATFGTLLYCTTRNIIERKLNLA